MRILMIADDLTGALDTGVQFAQNGIDAEVFPFPADRPHGKLKAVIERSRVSTLVVDAASRHLQPHEAASRVSEIVLTVRRAAATRGADRPLLYKKTDSTLRGNVGAELQALLTAGDTDVVVFAPAYPRMGRITLDGVQFIDGVPLDCSEFANDSRQQMRDATVADIIARQTDVATDLLTVRQIRNGDRPSASPRRIVICDSETDADLNRIVDWLQDSDFAYSLAGCGGFASVIASRFRADLGGGKSSNVSGARSYRGQECGYAPSEFEISTGHGVLLVCGSRHSRSQSQVQFASQKGVLKPAGDHNGDFQFIAPPEDLQADPNAVAERLAEAALVSLRTMQPRVLVAFGGDTTAAVLRRVGVKSVYPVYEFEPGVVVSRIDAGLIPNLKLLVTKAGGFGSVDVLAKLDEHLYDVVERGMQCAWQ